AGAGGIRGDDHGGGEYTGEDIDAGAVDFSKCGTGSGCACVSVAGGVGGAGVWGSMGGRVAVAAEGGGRRPRDEVRGREAKGGGRWAGGRGEGVDGGGWGGRAGVGRGAGEVGGLCAGGGRDV